jgi:Enoyl-CoA hydratase/carnithine racemase
MINQALQTGNFDNTLFPHHFILRERTSQNVAILRIQHSHGANILNPAVLSQLDQVVSAAISDPSIRSVIITASEPGFVFGAEINFFIRHIEQCDLEPIHAFTRLGNRCFDRIASSPKPVVAVMNGPAFGGGLELALACHARLTVPGTVMTLPEVGIGLCPIWGGILRLRQLIGKEMAKSVIYTGRNISAKEAFEIGIVDYISSRDEIMKMAVEISLTNSKIFRSQKNNEASDHFLQLLKNETIDSFFHLKSLDSFDKKTQISIKQVCNKSYLALKYCELIFGWDEQISTEERDHAYYEIVERLYRSEDTITGLNWKRDKKIGLPNFVSKTSLF